MKLHRFYSKFFSENSVSIELDSLQSNHLIKALRLNEGGSVEVFNGNGLSATFKIKELRRNKAILIIEGKISEAASKNYKVMSILPVLKKDNLNFMIQKVVEIGVDKVFFYKPDLIDQSIAKKDIQKIVDKVEDIVVGACKQSGRNFVPKVEYLGTLYQTLSSDPIKSDSELIAFDFIGEKKLLITDINSKGNTSIITGPESGFSEKEKELLVSENVSIRRLGSNTLRAETAAVVGLTLAQNFLGEL